ncbi:MAG: sigma-70 family RNA polymerase sigma factor [Acidobacteriota bacterium]
MARSDKGLELLRTYVGAISGEALLDPDEETALARRWRQERDDDALRRLVSANLRLVVKIAFDHGRVGHNILDLIQEGNVGLLLAVMKFDPARGVKLSTYASWWIRAYMLRFTLNNARLVKLGTTQAQRKIYYNFRREQARLAAMGIDPSAEKVAERLGVQVRDVAQMDLRMGAPDLSLDAPAADADGEDGRSLLERIPAPGAGPDEVLASLEKREALDETLRSFAETLHGRERSVFERRLWAEEPRTLKEIGDEFGVSRERVRQIETRVLRSLRRHLAETIGAHLELES